MDAGEHLESRFGFTQYRVPPESADDFLALHQKAAEVYREHALGWRLARGRTKPEEWVEFGPTFRERRDLERAAAALEGERVLERLAGFGVGIPSLEDVRSLSISAGEPDDSSTIEVDPLVPVERDEDEGPTSLIVVETSSEQFDTVLEVGAHPFAPSFDRDLPPLDPADMTPAMRLAQRLAAALASQLDAAVPEPFRVVAEQEAIYLLDDGPFRMGGSIVDQAIEGAVWRVLEDVQQEVTERITVPWPHDPERGYVFHEPGVALRDGAVHFWYGSESSPALAFDPIPLSELEP